MFSLFQTNPQVHLRRAMALLREAHMARIEHQAAAEHHKALAAMYAQRAARLEREIYDNRPMSLRENLDGGATPTIDEKAPLFALDGRRRANAIGR
jgi:hypothetical protein